MSEPLVFPAGAPCWIELNSSDMDRARAFYGDLFGWDSEASGPEFGGYLGFASDGDGIAGGMPCEANSPGADTWTIYLRVDDIATSAAAAKAAGAQVVLEPMQVGSLGWMAALIDPGGASIGLWQTGDHLGFQALARPGAPAWFELLSTDYDAALPFYADVLAWDTHTMSDTPEFRYSTYGSGDDARAGIMDASGMNSGLGKGGWCVYVAVADTDAAVADAIRLGGACTMDPHDTPFGRIAQLTDPTGTMFLVVSG